MRHSYSATERHSGLATRKNRAVPLAKNRRNAIVVRDDTTLLGGNHLWSAKQSNQVTVLFSCLV